MPRKPNNDPAVLLERANKQRERWSKAQTTYLERPENKEKHQEAVNSYYERNKEKLRQKANERNAKKREATKPVETKAETKAEPETPKKNVMEKAVSALRKVETETKKRNRNRKVAAQLQQVVADTNARNAERKRQMMNRSQMAKEDKDASALPDLPITVVDDETPVAIPATKKVVRRKKVVAPVVETPSPSLHISEIKETEPDEVSNTTPQGRAMERIKRLRNMIANHANFYKDSKKKVPLIFVRNNNTKAVYEAESDLYSSQNAIGAWVKPTPEIIEKTKKQWVEEHHRPEKVKGESTEDYLKRYNLTKLRTDIKMWYEYEPLDTYNAYSFKKHINRFGDSMYTYDEAKDEMMPFKGNKADIKFSNQKMK